MKAADQKIARKAAHRNKLIKRLLMWTAVAVPFIALAALLDPQREDRAARDAAAQQELAARQAVLEQVPESKRSLWGGHDGDVVDLSFSKLEFEVPPEAARPKEGQPNHDSYTPERIKSYNGRTVRLRGYMLPVKMEEGKVRECLLMAGQMTCCYGASPNFWEFVSVRMADKPVPSLMDVPLVFEGTLKVGDVYDNGYWTQFYTMDATSVSR
ncbi:Protein of unknown function (DUF3299) [Opitutaceae bacterium TAV1]|nr:Protein of unknown function (DUF3299) [Opitutaceae bacterium TAV1]